MIRHRIASLAYCVVALTAFSLIALPSSAKAQTAGAAGTDTLIVSPPVNELSADPGQTVEQKITLTNSTSASRTFTATIQNAQPSGDQGAANLVADEGPLALAAWVTAEPATIDVPAGTSQEFTVKIAVPENAGPGSHAGAVVFSPSALANDSGASVSVVSEISSLLLVNVSGDVEKKLALTSFGAEKGFYQHGPVEFSAVFKNDGNIVLKPEGNVIIKNSFGKVVATLPIEPQRVLPTAERKFTVKLDQKRLFGAYTASVTWKADSVSGSGDKDRVWVAPLQLLIPAAVGLVFLVLIVWLPRRRWRAAFRAMRDAEKNDPQNDVDSSERP